MVISYSWKNHCKTTQKTWRFDDLVKGQLKIWMIYFSFLGKS